MFRRYEVIAGRDTYRKFRCRSYVRYAFPSSRPIRPVTIDRGTINVYLRNFSLGAEQLGSRLHDTIMARAATP